MNWLDFPAPVPLQCTRMTIDEQSAENGHYDIALIGFWFGCNYGAILTTYALYRFFTDRGLKVLLLNQAPLAGNPMYLDPRNISHRFMERYGVKCSQPLQSDAELEALNEVADTFVVGSDQVWRWAYTSYQGFFYFMDFVRGEKRKIAVASSFGIDWEERPADNLAKAGLYLQAFDAVSVREDSGVKVLREHYGVEGEWVADPVFLHGDAFYRELADGAADQPAEPYLFAYVLDETEEIRELINSVARQRGLRVFTVEDAHRLVTTPGGDEARGRIPEPEQWLQYIRDCAFFVTDSFHGVCFAHIFHKDFLCVAPQGRGLARLHSLLALSGLADRLQEQLPYNPAVAQQAIPWDAVDERLHAARAKAAEWIEAALNRPRDPRRVALGTRLHRLLYAGRGECERDWWAHGQVQSLQSGKGLAFLAALVRAKARLLRLAGKVLPGRKGRQFTKKAGTQETILRQLELERRAARH